jgi:hypothetical protein
VILHGAVTPELRQEALTREGIDESIEVEGAKVGGWNIVGPSDDEPQVWIRRERGRGFRAHQADVDAFAEPVEEIQERFFGQSRRVHPPTFIISQYTRLAS